jgi:hypothetical protein
MSNDAKLGLVLGVAIVLVIGLVFFRNDTAVARLPAENGRTTTALTSEPRERPVSKAGVGPVYP